MALYFLSTIRLPSLVLRQGTTLLTRYKKSVYFDYTTEERFFDFKQEQDVSAFLTRPDRLWGPPSLLFSVYRRLFPLG
jgi:hypothetical protein